MSATPSTQPTLLREHRLFLIALAAGAVLRLAVVVAFPPGFVFSDGPTYLSLVGHLFPLAYRAAGYGVLLDALSRISPDIWLVTAVQHLLGLATAVLMYVVLRRRGVGGGLATLATLPVLLDSMELALEHSVLSDTFFDLLVVAAVAALAWHRVPGVRSAALGGLLLGLAVCVRVVGQPLVVVGLACCLWAAVTWRAKLVTAVALAVAFAVPVASYAAWYHAEHGIWALSESGGRALYMRTTAFVDCTKFTVPDYERQLCPTEPVGQRQDPTQYGWHMPDGTHDLHPPKGVTDDEAMGDFARAAIRAQPWDYVRVVARDAMLGYTMPRVDRYEYDTASKWQLDTYVSFRQTDWTRPAYLAHGGALLDAKRPLADLLGWYSYVVYAWGPLMFLLTAVSFVGLFLRRKGPEPDGNRPFILLTLGLGGVLMLVPAVTAQFVWRYQMPYVLLVPMAAALAITRLLAQRAEAPGTVATPSTDWPNGGVNRRSANRVVGTTNRS